MNKTLLPLLMLGFGVALAVIIGQKMSQDAMSVVIGVAVGVAASVPTSLLLVALLRRERGSYRDVPPQPAYPQLTPPQVMVLDPSLWNRQQLGISQPLPPLTAANDGGVRRLKVIGGDDDNW